MVLRGGAGLRLPRRPSSSAGGRPQPRGVGTRSARWDVPLLRASARRPRRPRCRPPPVPEAGGPARPGRWSTVGSGDVRRGSRSLFVRWRGRRLLELQTQGVDPERSCECVGDARYPGWGALRGAKRGEVRWLFPCDVAGMEGWMARSGDGGSGGVRTQLPASTKTVGWRLPSSLQRLRFQNPWLSK